MLSLTVQTLDGHALQVEVDPTGCVKDVRKLLADQYGLSKCALYLQVRCQATGTVTASSLHTHPAIDFSLQPRCVHGCLHVLVMLRVHVISYSTQCSD